MSNPRYEKPMNIEVRSSVKLEPPPSSENGWKGVGHQLTRLAAEIQSLPPASRRILMKMIEEKPLL